MASALADTAWPSLYDRLKGLMAFRVGLVTLLLGGAVATDISRMARLSNPVNLVLLGLVLLTYILTLVYALVLDRVEDIRQLAYFQVAVDMVMAIALVAVTSGLGSIFLFVLYLVIINAAAVAGRLGALYAAGATSLAMIGLGVLTSAGVEHPLLNLDRSRELLWPLWFEVGANCAAAFLIALLSGHLAERLSQISGALTQKHIDLQNLRRLTQNIVESVDSGILATDETRHIFFFNRAAAEITGRSREEVVGQKLGDLFPEIDEQMERASRDESESHRAECTYESPQGDSRHLGFSVSPLTNSEGEKIGDIVVFQDLTGVKRLQEEKQRSQRMAAVGELAASVAHEIRNPLASISGSVEMLEAADEESREELLDIVLREVERLDDLIADFLEYSEPPSLSAESTDLGDLTREVLDLYSNQAGADTDEIELIVEQGDLTAEVDRESIRQVLWNLLENAGRAADAAANSPAIRISLAPTRREGKPAVTLTVEDAGPGIPAEERDRIFDPFYTTREDGSGLGLATAYQLV
ncbi:MAG: nitrogen regulation protein NR(II), partial [Bradymonadaceae bacterium]